MSFLMMFMRDSPLNKNVLKTGGLYCSFKVVIQSFDEFLVMVQVDMDMDKFGNLQLVAYNTSKTLPGRGERSCYPVTTIMHH